MIIRYHKGDILEADQTLIAHGCNAMGVMGAGVAKVIRKNYPWAYEQYRNRYKTRKLILGEVVMSHNEDMTKYVANCITQYQPGRNVDYEAIKQCFLSLDRIMEDHRFTEIAMPWIGCGIAGGDRETVKGIMADKFGDGKEVHIYELK